MSDQKRAYRKGRRAELERQTHRRITESTVELHGTVGPARTSISAVAERAGVRRSTVYRHFPDEAALFAACSAHWMASHPPPDLEAWAGISDEKKRLTTALTELYGYYRETEPMLANLHRDEATVPLVRELFAGFHSYLSAARDLLTQGTDARGLARRRVRASIGHSLAFTTWRSLTGEQGFDDPQAVDLMCRLVDAAARRAPDGRRPGTRRAAGRS